MTEAIRASDLLEHLDWVRALARSLLREDPSAADDAVQETWIAATRNPPPEKSAIRPWLRTLLRRRIGQVQKSDRRRAAREQSVARNEVVESTADVVARAAAHRDVVGALMRLAEPYRSTLVLRYFEGLGPTAIAEREGLPVDTVRSHLRRGLAKLRLRLEDERGGARESRRALVALVGVVPTDHTVPTTGVSTTKIVVGACAVLALGAIAFHFFVAEWRSGGAPSVSADRIDTQEARRQSASANATRATPERSVEQASARRAVVPIGRVVDLSGAPMGGLRLRRDGPYTVRWQGGDVGWVANELSARRVRADLLARLRRDPVFAQTWFEQFEHPDEWKATILGASIPSRESVTAEDGTFSLEGTKRFGAMHYSSASGDVVLLTHGVDGRGVRTWIAARVRTVQGRTLDVDGSPVASSFVSWNFATPPAAYDELTTASYRRASVEVRTGADGRYLLRGVPVSHPVLVQARTKTGRNVTRPLVLANAAAFDLTYGPLPRSIDLRGVVVDPSGQGVEDASVVVGSMETRTERGGVFEFSNVVVDDGMALTAWVSGYVPARHANLARALESGRLLPASIVLRLPRRSRTLRGRVVDRRGVAVPRVSLSLFDPTQLDTSFRPLEARVGDRDWHVVADEDGRFELTGLAERAYRIRCWRDGVGLLVSRPVAPTVRDVILTVDTPTRRHGTVVDHEGNPIAHARVAIQFLAFVNRSGAGTMSETKVTRADASGRFELQAASKRFGLLLVEAPDGTRSTHPVAGQPDGEDLILRHGPKRRVVQIVPEHGFGWDRAQFLDAEGGVVSVDVHARGRIRQLETVIVADDVVPWVAIPSTAKTLVLRSNGREVRRSPITPRQFVLRGSQ